MGTESAVDSYLIDEEFRVFRQSYFLRSLLFSFFMRRANHCKYALNQFATSCYLFCAGQKKFAIQRPDLISPGDLSANGTAERNLGDVNISPDAACARVPRLRMVGLGLTQKLIKCAGAR